MMPIGFLPLARPTARDALGLPRRVGELAVRAGLAVRDLPQLLPDAALERRAGQAQRQVELRQLAGEVGVELADRLARRARRPRSPKVSSAGRWRCSVM